MNCCENYEGYMAKRHSIIHIFGFTRKIGAGKQGISKKQIRF